MSHNNHIQVKMSKEPLLALEAFFLVGQAGDPQET